MYNYFGIAVLVGLLGGLLLAFMSTALYSWLGLDARMQPDIQPPRTGKQYREDKAKLKRGHDHPLLSSHGLNGSDGVGKGNLTSRTKSLLAQTIMEEADSDY